MALRVKTVWFKKEGEQRDPSEVATVLASTIWRLCDRTIDNLSKADFDIITPQRGFRIIGEMACFLVHYVDRLAFNRMDDELRQDVVSAVGVRLAEIMEENIIETTGGEKDPDYDYQAGFIDLTNRRMGDYAAFDFPDEQASFPALRFLSLQIREIMEQSDQTWIQDQIMEIEMPEMQSMVKKNMDGFYPAESKE
ncbi:MAG: hypothetical protein Q8M09_01815 [Pseudomonadota bacterium]|nr:hypothetical protein [Pseudomonadota bacterium]MDP1902980.1 hypothetical protein [Pseudomonadota bacterium]MDP2352248.1 hypothetical protein [Pseudomonadota bacterium]